MQSKTEELHSERGGVYRCIYLCKYLHSGYLRLGIQILGVLQCVSVCCSVLQCVACSKTPHASYRRVHVVC